MMLDPNIWTDNQFLAVLVQNGILKVILLLIPETAQWKRVQSALPEDLGSILTTHMPAHNCVYLQLQRVQHLHTDDVCAGKHECTLNKHK